MTKNPREGMFIEKLKSINNRKRTLKERKGTKRTLKERKGTKRTLKERKTINTY